MEHEKIIKKSFPWTLTDKKKSKKKEKFKLIWARFEF